MEHSSAWVNDGSDEYPFRHLRVTFLFEGEIGDELWQANLSQWREFMRLLVMRSREDNVNYSGFVSEAVPVLSRWYDGKYAIPDWHVQVILAPEEYIDSVRVISMLKASGIVLADYAEDLEWELRAAHSMPDVA